MKKLLMALALLPLMAAAEMETVGGLTWSYEVQDDCAVITGVSPEPCGALTLPGRLGGRPISLQNESSWRELMAQVTSLTIPDTIVTIPDGAFQVYEDGYFDEQIWDWVVTGSSGWVSLAEVDIPTSVTKIGRWSFENTPLMKNGGKPYVPVYSKDGRWLLGFSRMYEDYEWATYQEYVEARSVRIPATVQFAVDGSLGEICSEVPGYFLEGSRVTFLGDRPAGLTEAAFNSTTDEIEEGPKAVYYLEGAAGWTHGETWCGVKTYSSGELSPEQKTKSELSLGLVYEGGYRYGDYVAIGFKMTEHDLRCCNHVRQLSFAYPGRYKNGYAEEYALVPVYGAKTIDEIVPVVDYGSVGIDRIGAVEVWTDQQVMEKFMPPYSTHGEWKREDRGRSYEYTHDSMQKKEWEEYDWPVGLWPDGTAVPSRFWISVDAKTMMSLNSGKWEGVETFRIGLRGTSEWTPEIKMTYDLVQSPYPVKMSELLRGLSFGGLKDLRVEKDECAPDGSVFNNVLLVSGSMPVVLTLPLAEAGILYLYGEEENDEDGVGRDHLTVSGAGIVSDTQLGYQDLYSNYEDRQHDLCDLGGAGVLRKVEVCKATTLTLKGKHDWRYKLDANRIQFFPASSKAIAVEAAFGRYLQAEADAIGYDQGYVKGMGVYKVGETVNLTAVPGEGEAFDHWKVLVGEIPAGVDLTASSISFQVSSEMAGDAADRKQLVLRAIWKEKCAVTALSTRAGAATMSGSGFYFEGEQVRLEAVPARGCSFVKWLDGCTDNPRIVTAASSPAERVYYAVIDGRVPDPIPPGGCAFVVDENGVLKGVEGKVPANLVIPTEVDGRPVVKIGEKAFQECAELKTVVVGGNVREIGRKAFCGCVNLRDVELSEGLEVVGDSAFTGAFSAITIPSSVREIGRCNFTGCPFLTSIKIAAGGSDRFAVVNGVLYDKVGKRTICACANLKMVALPDDCEIVGQDTFLMPWQAPNASVLEAVSWPHNLKRIEQGAFHLCKKLHSGDFSQTELEMVEEDAFVLCTSLTKVVFPATLKMLTGHDFSCCAALRRVYFAGNAPCVLRKTSGNKDMLDCIYVTTPNLDVNYSDDKQYRYSYLQDVVTYVQEGTTGWGDIPGVWQGRPIRYVGMSPLDKPLEILPGEVASFDTELIGYTASGLPSGLKYDKTTGMITGAATKPTAAEGVIVKFTKSGAETEEMTIVIGPVPKIGVALEGDTDGCKVTGAGAYLVGKTVTLKVTTKKGTAFAGFYQDGEPWPNESDYKKTSLAYTMDKDDVSLVATFEKEKMSVGCAGLSDGSFTAGVAGSPEGIPLEIETQSGVKSVKVEKLPAGMKYDAKKKVITGAPTKAGDNKVVITVTAVSGAVEKKEITVPVAAMSETAVGMFNGFVANGEQRIGTFTLTTTDAGKLTAKVITAGGTVSFSGTCWDSLEDGVCKVTLTTKKGEFMTLALDSNAAWDANQLTGTYSPPNMTGWFDLSAQRNAFGKTWYFTAVGNEPTGWTFAYTKDAKAAALTVTLKADGSTAIAGKLGSIKISASGYADVSGMREGAILADFAPVVTVSKVKKVLSIHTNLWFDRSNDHGDGVGGAELVE